MSSWLDVPRTKDKVAFVGFANTTRDMAPWNDPDYEIWTVNEGYNFPWLKRFDRLFQIHPRWDFSRNGNGNDPNHFLWLKNKIDQCCLCQGAGHLKKKEDESAIIPCPYCKDGLYTPLSNRETTRAIYMQREYDDIPGSVEFPLKEATALLPLNGYPYFTSSFSYMLSMAYMMEFKSVEIYGFEMGASTEYHYQRSNAEYLMGYFQGKGLNIYLPKESSLLKGLLYGYRNMRTGYRQQVEMRDAILGEQLKVEDRNLARLEGQVQILQDMKLAIPDEPKIDAAIANVGSIYGKKLGLVNIIKGAKRETQNLRDMYDTYFLDNPDMSDEDKFLQARQDTKEFVETVYDV